MRTIKNRYLLLTIISTLSLYQCGPEGSLAQTDNAQFDHSEVKKVVCKIGPDKICRFPVQALNTEYDAKGYSVMYSQFGFGPKFEKLKIIFADTQGVSVHEASYTLPLELRDQSYAVTLNQVQSMAVEISGFSSDLLDNAAQLEFETRGALIALSEQTVSESIAITPPPEKVPANPPKKTPRKLTDYEVFKSFSFSDIEYENAQEIFQTQLSGLSNPKNISGEILQTGSLVELEPLRRTELKNGTVVTRYQQSVLGIPIARGDLTLTQDGETARLSGQFLSEIKNQGSDARKLKTELFARLANKEDAFKQTAIKAYREAFGEDASSARTGKEDYAHYLRQVDGGLALTTSISFLFRTERGLQNPIVIIDTATNEVLSVDNGVRQLDDEAKGHGGNRNTGRYIFGEQNYPALKIQKDQEKCRLENNVFEHSNGLVTNHFWMTDEFDPEAFEFNCSAENRNQQLSVPEMDENSDWDSVIVDAYSPLNDSHALSGLIMEMFTTRYAYYYEALALNQAYPKLAILAHQNEEDGAEYAENVIYVRDGVRGFSFPTAVSDIIGHEMGHWFSDLWKQSKGFRTADSRDFKAIEESYGDMLAVVTDQHLSDNYDYPSLSIEKIGESTFPGATDYVRDICNPEQVSHKTHISDNMTRHDKAGLFNKAFCELSQKEGWDYYKSFEVFTHAHLFHWDNQQSFSEAALHVRTSALTLGYDADSVGEAFQSVGICFPGFSNCDDGPIAPDGNMQRYVLTERLMLTESSSDYCPMNDNGCYQDKCHHIFGADFTKAGCFAEGDSFLCAVECESEVRL